MYKIKLFIRDSRLLNGENYLTPIRDIIKKSCAAVLYEEKFRKNAEISISFVNEDEIQRLNRDFRGKDKSTDVLSFPMGDINLDNGCVVLGDIVICAEKLVKQAEEYHQSEERELTFLVIHSMLHLFGYDHENSIKNGAVMRKKQRKILRILGKN